jgi:hypothetical protein
MRSNRKSRRKGSGSSNPRWTLDVKYRCAIDRSSNIFNVGGSDERPDLTDLMPNYLRPVIVIRAIVRLAMFGPGEAQWIAMGMRV